MEELYLALDVGGSNISLGLGDGKDLIDGKQRKVKTDKYWTEEKLKELVQETLDEFDVSINDLNGIGVAVPGLIDVDKKEMIYSYSLSELEFQYLKDLDADLRVENDANAAVLGEKFYGGGEDAENLVTVIIGSGVGGGVYYGGRLLGSEEDGRSPEPAGIIVEKDTKWDRAVGGERMPNYAETFLKPQERETELSTSLTAQEIFELSETDEVAEEYVAKLSDLNARGIATLINMYAPELITFSGSVAVQNPEFMQDSFNKVQKHAINPVPDMKISKLKNDLGLYGALALAQGKNQ